MLESNCICKTSKYSELYFGKLLLIHSAHINLKSSIVGC